MLNIHKGGNNMRKIKQWLANHIIIVIISICLVLLIINSLIENFSVKEANLEGTVISCSEVYEVHSYTPVRDSNIRNNYSKCFEVAIIADDRILFTAHTSHSYEINSRVDVLRREEHNEILYLLAD